VQIWACVLAHKSLLNWRKQPPDYALAPRSTVTDRPPTDIRATEIMKRRLLMVTLFLGTGVVTSVAVAWCLAMSRDGFAMGGNLKTGRSSAGEPSWTVAMQHRFGSTVVSFCRVTPLPGGLRRDANPKEIRQYAVERHLHECGAWPSNSPPSRAVIRLPLWSRARSTTPGRHSRLINFVEDARGWPARSLVSYFDHEGSLQRRPNQSSRYVPGAAVNPVWGIRLGDTKGPSGLPRTLPLRPIWRGLLVNSLFYAVLLWFLVLLRSRVRRLMRRRHGLCPRCAYRLCGEFSQGCPECGWRRKENGAMPGTRR
jgi:hypothetical protein